MMNPMIEKASSLEVQVGGNHYKNLGIQPIVYIHANNIPFIEGNVIKYITRWRLKNGLADLEKAKHFIEMLIELEKETTCKSTSIKNGPAALPSTQGQMNMDSTKPSTLPSDYLPRQGKWPEK